MALRIVVFGQAAFARDVTLRLAEAGHDVVGVFVPPDRGRPDPMAAEARQRGWPLFRHRRFRRKGVAIPELVAEYLELGAELNVLPFTTVILPPEIVDAPEFGSLCFHPSLLPAYRGGAAIAWQIMLGETRTGVSVFRPDAGVDTGPIVLQRAGVSIDPTDTAASLYFDKLYPLGVEAMVEAVGKVADGSADFSPQSESGASFQGLVDDAAARIDWKRSAAAIDRQIRGCDPQPGAYAEIDGVRVRLFGAQLEPGAARETPGTVVALEAERLVLAAVDGRISVGKLGLGEAPKVAAKDAGLAVGARFD
ncbi:MAG: methionyl-tRNA formyltransferase [Myxococcota bacterium]